MYSFMLYLFHRGIIIITDLKIDEVNINFDMEVTASSSNDEDCEGDKENID